MLESFKEVLEKEREAEKIITKAEKQAEKIKKNAHERAKLIFKETYQGTIAEAKRKSIEMKKRAKKDAESEAKIFIKQAEKIRKKILANAEQKLKITVNSILHEIIS